MTDDQSRELRNAVIDSKEASNSVKRELAGVRGEVAQLTGAVHSLRGEVIILGAKVELLEDEVPAINAKLGAMMQTIDGMNHLAKSAYDMASDHVTKLKSLAPHLEAMTGTNEQRTKAGSR